MLSNGKWEGKRIWWLRPIALITVCASTDWNTVFSGCHRFDHTMCINWSDSLVAFKREYAEYISLWSQMCINRLENCVLWWYMCPVTCYQEVVFSSNKTLAKCCKPSAASRVLHAECCKPSAACHVLHAKCCMSRAAPQAVEKTCRCDHNLYANSLLIQIHNKVAFHVCALRFGTISQSCDLTICATSWTECASRGLQRSPPTKRILRAECCGLRLMLKDNCTKYGTFRWCSQDGQYHVCLSIAVMA